MAILLTHICANVKGGGTVFWSVMKSRRKRIAMLLQCGANRQGPCPACAKGYFQVQDTRWYRLSSPARAGRR